MIPIAGVTPSQSPKISEVLTDRATVGLRPPRAIDTRKLSRLSVNPSERSANTGLETVGGSRPAICHGSGAVTDRRWLRWLERYSGSANANSADPPACASAPG